MYHLFVLENGVFHLLSSSLKKEDLEGVGEIIENDIVYDETVFRYGLPLSKYTYYENRLIKLGYEPHESALFQMADEEFEMPYDCSDEELIRTHDFLYPLKSYSKMSNELLAEATREAVLHLQSLQ